MHDTNKFTYSDLLYEIILKYRSSTGRTSRKKGQYLRKKVMYFNNFIIKCLLYVDMEINIPYIFKITKV